MAKIDWDQGQLITLGQGETASCSGGLNKGQIYALFFYNSADNDASTTVQVVWGNSEEPVEVTVPGTTGQQGLAALCFVNGDQTNTVSAAVTNVQPGAKIQAFIGSVKMPINTAGINNEKLPLDGSPQPFEAFTRFYAVPASHWYHAHIQSNIDQFICVQFSEQKAKVIFVNALEHPSSVIHYVGNAKDYVTEHEVHGQTISWKPQGNGKQMVWINADSIQNSQSATIAVQSLQALQEADAALGS